LDNSLYDLQGFPEFWRKNPSARKAPINSAYLLPFRADFASALRRFDARQENQVDA
jgi:hypothetical protein